MTKFAQFALAAVLAASASAQPKMVRLNVTAFDSHGQPAGDLTKADFQIQDAGKDQPLAFFHANGNVPGTVSHSTLILFDLLNADITNRTFAADEIVRSLQGRESSELLSFYLLTPDLKLQTVHSLPVSASDIRPADKPWTKDIKAMLADALKNANQLRQGGLTEDERVRRTLGALTTVVSSMATLPGQKNVVWISRGVPVSLRVAGGGDQIDYKPMLRELAKVCVKQRVTVYAVSPSASAVPSQSELASVDTLQTLANLTGGRLYTANGIGKAVTQSADGWRGSYTLAYVPSAESWDGKLHKLKIASTRRGIDLLSPDSYYADRPDTTESMRNALQGAVSSPFDSPEIRLRVTVEKTKIPGMFNLQIRANYDDALVTEKDGRYVTDLVFTILDYSVQGPKSVTSPNIMNISMNQQQSNAAQKDGILLTQDHAVEASIERMRIIVYDPATGQIGSTMVPVKQ
jgi:VWFA-related protein